MTTQEHEKHERAVLGALLLGDDDARLRLLDRLEGWMFSDERHRTVLRAVELVWMASPGFSVQDLVNNLADREQIEQAGGAEYVVELTEHAPLGSVTDAMLTQLATAGHREGLRRRLLGALDDLDSRTVHPSDLHDRLEYALWQLPRADGSRHQRPKPFKDLMWPLFDWLEDRQVEESVSDAGTSILASLLSDLPQGAVIAFVGPRAEAGAWNAVGAWLDAKERVLMLSDRHDERGVACRILAPLSGVPLLELGARRLQDGDFGKLAEAAGAHSNNRLWANCEVESWLDCLKLVRLGRVDHDVHAVLLDTARLVSYRGGGEPMTFGTLASAAQRLARELEVRIALWCDSSEWLGAIRAPRDTGSLTGDMQDVLAASDIVVALWEAEEQPTLAGRLLCYRVLASRRGGWGEGTAMLHPSGKMTAGPFES